MPIRKTPVTFDQHLGSVIDGFAKARGGRDWLVTLSDWSKGTVERRVTGRTEFTVKELELVAAALGTTRATIVEQALRNYSGTTVEDGVEKLIQEESPAVSPPPVSLDERRTKKPSEWTEGDLESYEGPQAANTDDEIGHDESDPA